MRAEAPCRLGALLALMLALGVIPRAAAAQYLYWLDTSYGAPTLNRADADGVAQASLARPAGSLPEGLAVGTNGRVYWAEAAWTNATIGRAAANFAGPTSIVTGGSVFRGIAIDDVVQRLYWTSSNLATGSRVHRAALDGTGAMTLIALGAAANPRGIAVDRVGSKLYWADFDQNAIYRSNLDGTAPGVWLATPGAGPYGVAVDAAAQLVYWTEYSTGLVRRATTAAAGVTTLLSGLSQPTYLALDVIGGRMYWSEGGAGTQRIRRATMGGAAMVTLPPPLTTYGGLAYWAGGATPVPDVALPTEFALDGPWPSPGSAPIHVAFSLPRAANARLAIFDLQGREIAVLADGVLPAGRHERVWNGARASAAAGVYFVRFAADGRHWTRRLVLTR